MCWHDIDKGKKRACLPFSNPCHITVSLREHYHGNHCSQKSSHTTQNASSSQTLPTLSPTPHLLLNHFQQVSLNENPKLARLHKSQTLLTRPFGHPRILVFPRGQEGFHCTPERFESRRSFHQKHRCQPLAAARGRADTRTHGQAPTSSPLRLLPQLCPARPP